MHLICYLLTEINFFFLSEEDISEDIKSISEKELTKQSNASSSSEMDFVAIDKSDLYSDDVSYSFLHCCLTKSVDCSKVMICKI